MRNALLISLGVLFIVVAGGFGINWYFQAMHARNAIEKAISDINTPTPYITYDSIQTSGFPDTMMISIINPRFKGRIDQMLIAKGASKLPEWSEDIALLGSISIAVNSWSDRYSGVIRGEWQQKGRIAGKDITMKGSSAGDALCVLQLERGSIFSQMWNMQRFSAEQLQSMGDQFRSLDCSAPERTAVNETGETLMHAGPSRIYIENIKENGRLSARFFFKASDIEASPKADELIAAYLLALDPTNPAPLKLSAYGKQAIDIDMSYQGPEKLEGIGKNDNFSMSVSKFDFTSAASTTNMAFLLSNALAGDARTSRLMLKSTSSFTPLYDKLMDDTLRSYIAQAYAEGEQVPDIVSKARNQYNAQQLFDIISPAMPKFGTLGAVKLSLDIDATSNAQATKGNATLNDIELSAADYGITGKGSVQLDQPPIPSSNTVLACRNCLRLVDDVTAYAQRLGTALAAIDPELGFTVNPKLADGYKQFLTSLGTAPLPDTLQFQLISHPQSGFTINGKDTMAVMQLYNQYVAPYLPPRQPQPILQR